MWSLCCSEGCQCPSELSVRSAWDTIHWSVWMLCPHPNPITGGTCSKQRGKTQEMKLLRLPLWPCSEMSPAGFYLLCWLPNCCPVLGVCGTFSRWDITQYNQHSRSRHLYCTCPWIHLTAPTCFLNRMSHPLPQIQSPCYACPVWSIENCLKIGPK